MLSRQELMSPTLTCRWHAAVLLCILIAGFSLRISGINWGFIFDRKFHFISTTEDDQRRQLRSVGQLDPRRLDFNPEDAQREGPLFSYVTAASLLVAQTIGYAHVSPDEAFYRAHPDEMRKLFVVSRIAAVLFGVLEIVMIFLIGKRFFSPATGLLAAAFMAVIPMEVVQSTYARSLTLANLMLLVTLYAALHIAYGDQRKRFLALAGIAVGFAFSTRFSMLPIAFCIPAAELASAHQNGLRAWKMFSTTFLNVRSLQFIGWTIGGIALSNPYLFIQPVETLSAMTSQIGYGDYALGIVARAQNIFISIFHTLPIATSELVAIASAGGLLLLLYRKHALSYIFVFFAIPYSVLALGGSLYAIIPRFTLPLVPFAALIGAVAVRATYGMVSRASAKLCMLTAVAAMIAYPLLIDLAYLGAARREHPISQLASWIESNVPTEATIGVTKINAHLKDIDFARYRHIVELGNFSNLDREFPNYIVLFRAVNDFAYGKEEWDRQHDRVKRTGYREVLYIHNPPHVGGLIFHERVTDKVEMEVSVYEYSG